MKTRVSIVGIMTLVLAAGCSGANTVKECLSPGKSFETFISDAFDGREQFHGFQMIEMSEDFVDRWDYSGTEIRYIVTAWREGFDPQDDGPGYSDVSVWIASSVDPPADVYSADGLSASRQTPWIGIEVTSDLLDSKVINRPINCTLAQLES